MDVLVVPDDGKNDDEVVALVEPSLSNGALRFFDPEELADLEVCDFCNSRMRISSGVLTSNPLNPGGVEIWELEGGRNSVSLTMTACLEVRLVNEVRYLSLALFIDDSFGAPSSFTGTASIISRRTLISLA